MNRIKVHVNYHAHSAGRGIGFYAENLINALRDNPEIELSSQNPDLIHYPFFDLFYPTLPLRHSAPTVVTIHDLTPLVLNDLYPKGIKGSVIFWRQCLALKGIRAIITDSENSKDDIVRLLGVDSKSVFSIPLAADPAFKKDVSDKQISVVKSKYALPDRFVLCVAGGPNPNKNLPLLAEATKRLNLPFVLVGKGITQDVSTEHIHPELKDLAVLKTYSHIITPGFVPTDDLVAMYRLASLYVQPSLYEGFGIPVLEAMSAGCLLIVANSSSLPEVVTTNTPMFDPYNLNNLIETIQSTLKMSASAKQKLISEAKTKANQYSWKKTSELTLQAYKVVL